MAGCDLTFSGQCEHPREWQGDLPLIAWVKIQCRITPRPRIQVDMAHQCGGCNIPWWFSNKEDCYMVQNRECPPDIFSASWHGSILTPRSSPVFVVEAGKVT